MKYLVGLVLLVSLGSQGAFAPVNGLELYYEVHGTGAPIVLVHGGGSTVESNWSRIIPSLSKKYQVIAIEEQGHGHTKAIARPFTFENSADDVAALLKHLKIDKATVMGFSNGGNIAMRVATRHPDQVSSIVVISAMFRRDGMVKGFWDGMKKASLENMPEELKAADRKINPEPKHLEALFKQDSERMQGFKDWPAKDLQSIQVPALIVVGDHDIVTPEHAIKMSRLIPSGRLAILPGGHGDFLGETFAAKGKSNSLPEATVQIVEAFLEESKNSVK